MGFYDYSLLKLHIFKLKSDQNSRKMFELWYFSFALNWKKPMFRLKLYLFRCKVCSSELIFNREDVTGHLKRAHSLSYGQYKSFFNGFSDVMTAKPELPAPRRSRRNNSILAELEPEILTSDSRIPVCQYACKECNSVFNRRQLIKHVIKVRILFFIEHSFASIFDWWTTGMFVACLKNSKF